MGQASVYAGMCMCVYIYIYIHVYLVNYLIIITTHVSVWTVWVYVPMCV